jgi:hypothetical protein
MREAEKRRSDPEIRELHGGIRGFVFTSNARLISFSRGLWVTEMLKRFFVEMASFGG